MTFRRREEDIVKSQELVVKKTWSIEKLRNKEDKKWLLFTCLSALFSLSSLSRESVDQVNGAVTYIEYLHRNIKNMSSKRNDLMLLSGRSFGSSNEQGLNEISNYVVIRPCLVGVEIMFSVVQTPFSTVLQVLSEYGLCVLGCSSSSVNDRLIHTLQAEVNDLALIDFADLKGTLTLMK